MDTRKKSLYKTISWRIQAFTINYFIVWWITGSSIFAIGLVSVFTITSFVHYYLHERLWERYTEK